MDLKQFQVEKFESEKGSWMACGKSHDNTFEVKGLLPGREYRFRVSAVNEFGDSDPAEAPNKICISLVSRLSIFVSAEMFFFLFLSYIFGPNFI
jgi:hypothetical protein